MTSKDYRASGCTALLDAIGGAIHHIVGIHRYARKEDIPDHTVFVITTDGMENASHHYSAERVKEMIRHEKDKYGCPHLLELLITQEMIHSKRIMKLTPLSVQTEHPRKHTAVKFGRQISLFIRFIPGLCISCVFL